jgi:hypothetical protein
MAADVRDDFNRRLFRFELEGDCACGRGFNFFTEC